MGVEMSDKLRFFDPDAPADDPIDTLLTRLSGDDSKAQVGCKILRNAETGKMAAVFPSTPFFPVGSPEQRKLESDWELRALAMTRDQQPMPALADKPVQIIPKYHEITIRRGD